MHRRRDASGATLPVSALACTRGVCQRAGRARFTGLLNGAPTVRINSRLLQLNSAPRANCASNASSPW